MHSNDRTPIYVAGYPKSGTTWLTRLLGAVINCPTGGSTPSQDETEIATEGLDRPQPYIVRKGHFTFVREKGRPFVPRPHKMNLLNFDPRPKVVFIIRDPRDIIVSGAHHWRKTIPQFADCLINGTGGVRSCGPWSNYIYTWLSVDMKVVVTKYESLYSMGSHELARIMRVLDFNVDIEYIEQIVEEQSFENRVKDINKHGEDYVFGKQYNLWFMRRGRPRAWEKQLHRTVGHKIQQNFGEYLEAFGYEKDPKWWSKLSA